MEVRFTGCSCGFFDEECYRIGRCEKVVEHGGARAAAEELARFPQQAVLADRRTVNATRGMPIRDGMKLEWANGVQAVANEGVAGAERFAEGPADKVVLRTSGQ